MDPIIFLLLLTSFFSYPFVLIAHSQNISKISVVGVVYCDTCSTSIFSKQSYFLPGVEVHIQCKVRATPKTTEHISFSVITTTDQYGEYKLDVPSVDGINCVDGSAIVSLCQASLVGTPSSSCNVPFLKSTTSEMSVKSKQDSKCIYTLSALSYKPPQKNTTVCATSTCTLDSSKLYFPYLPPYVLPLPPITTIPTMPLPPPMTTIPTIPFPPITTIPFPPITTTPTIPLPPITTIPSMSLPPITTIPTIPLPPITTIPSMSLPPITTIPTIPFPPPITTIPTIPFPPPITTIPSMPFRPITPFTKSPPSLPFPFPSTPPYAFSPTPFTLGDPKTWVPYIPSLSHPQPRPVFNLGDTRTWIPHVSPSPPNIPQKSKP